ncbi:MAG: hypothetical protein F6K16_16390 [Symploca sp. SIO2B6]|nr:hypothetical protein [Symploca sp. SIO2B6]
MTKSSTCNHFIHGKIISGNVYEIVARTADLTDQDQLNTIVETCQLLFAKLPNANPQMKAIGIFWYQESIILLQAMYAINANKQFVTDAFDRPFHQYRYVLIPIDFVTNHLRGRTFRLLSWITQQPIPLFPKQETNLQPLSIPHLNQGELDKEVKKIQKCLTETNSQGQPLLLSALAALLNQQRILIDSIPETISPTFYLESILLLLPASLRNYFSVAMGYLNEEYCQWAKLIIKFNGSPQKRKFDEDLFWLNRNTKKLEGKADQYTQRHNFVDDILRPIANATDRIPELLKRLDKITDDVGTLENPAYLKIVVRLIPVLPENLQEKVWEKWLPEKAEDEWHNIIQLIDDSLGLFVAWNKLGNYLKLDSVAQLTEICELMRQIWMRLPGDKRIQILQKLQEKENIFVAEKLLKSNFLQWHPLEAESNELISEICQLVQQTWISLPSEKLAQIIPPIQQDIFLTEKLLERKLLQWRPLEAETSELISQICQLIRQTWISLPGDKLIPILQEIQQNIFLAEKLLESNFLQWRPLEAESTEVVGKLRILCKKVVTHKSQQNWEQGWKFATYLAKDNIFREPKESFSLLDASFCTDVLAQHLYNSFNFKFAPLLPCVEAMTILESQWYQQLKSKDVQVAELLKRLLLQRNDVLENLQQLAQLTGINDAEKDYLYKAFLVNWVPSFAEARKLLDTIISDIQLSGNKFSRSKLEQTCEWFENKKPELRDIFYSLQQETIDWSTWNKLSNVLYENPQDCADLLDRVVGNIFPKKVMSKWLTIITNEEDLRKVFLEKSSVWQVLEHGDFVDIVFSSQQYAATLTRCCRDSRRYHWIKGDLLHYLCNSSIEQKHMDEDLKALVTSPSVVEGFTNKDWWNLQQLRWGLKFDLRLPFKDLTTTDQLKELIFNQAISIVNNFTEPEYRQSLFKDCATWGLNSEQLKLIAIQVVKSFTEPEQTKSFLMGCSLNKNEQKKILVEAPSQAYNVGLILPHLYCNGKVIAPQEEPKLVQLLLQAGLGATGERADLKKFFVDVLINQILPNNNLIIALKRWREQVIATHQELYEEAFSEASQEFVSKISARNYCFESFIKLAKYIIMLDQNELSKEADLMYRAFLKTIPSELLPRQLSAK